GADVDGHSESVASAATMHVLAVFGFPASQRSQPDSKDPTGDATARLGSSPRAIESSYARYGHYGAHAVWEADGRAQELQSEKQREEKLSTDSDLPSRDSGIRLRRTA